MAGKRLHLSSTVIPSATDDFKLIRGIGLAVETRLHDAGILTFAQFSAYSPEKIADAVTGLSSKRIIKEKWISQASKLARKNAVAKPRKGQGAPSRRQNYANFTVELLEMGDAHRTHVVHVESGETDTWLSWDAKRLTDFFTRHIAVHSLRTNSYAQEIVKTRRKASTIALDKSIPKVRETLQYTPLSPAYANIAGMLRLIDLQVIPVGSASPYYVLQQDQPFVMRLTLDLTQVVAQNDVTLICKATIIAKKLGGPHQAVGEVSRILKPADKATIDVAGTSLPTGIYRLEALVLVRIAFNETDPGLVAFMKGDIFQIY